MEPICRVCGAAHHGNVTCHECRKHMPFLSRTTRKMFESCYVGVPLGTPPDSQNIPIIKSINRHKKKIRKGRKEAKCEY